MGRFTSAKIVSGKAMLMCAAITLVACGGGGGGGGGSGSQIDDNPSRGALINDANAADVAVLAVSSLDSMSGFSSLPSDVLDTPPDEVEVSPEYSAASVRSARASNEQVWQAAAMESHDCDTGSVAVTQDGARTSIDYDQCVYAQAGGTSLTDGLVIQDDLGATAQYQNNVRSTSESYFSRYEQAGEYVQNLLNGYSLVSFTLGERYLHDMDLEHESRLVCAGRDESYSGRYDFVTTGERDGTDVVTTYDGQMTLNGNVGFNGTMTVETLEPVRQARHADHPYAGTLRIRAADGSTVVIRYVADGVYVNDRFYTWEEFDALVEAARGEDICFKDDEDDNDDDDENVPSISARIDGVEWVAKSGSITLHPIVAGGPGTLTLTATRTDAGYHGTSLSIMLIGITGPGIYQVDLSPDDAVGGWAMYMSLGLASGTPGVWNTNEAPGGTLTVEITALTDESIAGTFEFLGYSRDGTALAVTQGQFDGLYSTD